ncbi:CDP-alcohol phosphatidyltransferase family protein [soil metagenome]
MNLPNLITIGRILLVPLTIWLIVSSAYASAFLVFVVAGLSDAVDGFIARRYHLKTPLGTYLDPLADKLLLVSIYLTLGFLKVVPAWLVILVASRDVLIVGAIILSWLLDKPLRMHPLMISKVNTAGQIILAGGVLAMLGLNLPLALTLDMGSLVVGFLTVASGALYLREWARHMANGA